MLNETQRADAGSTSEKQSCVQRGPNTPDADPAADALLASLVEVEQYVGASGWGQPARLFSLVHTAEIVRREPSLAAELAGASPDSLTAVEDLDLEAHVDLEDALQGLRWPAAADGCAAVFENEAIAPVPRADIPTTSTPAVPRETCRVVVGVLRGGPAQGVVRLADGRLRGGVPTWAPNVIEALRDTLEPDVDPAGVGVPGDHVPATDAPGVDAAALEER